MMKVHRSQYAVNMCLVQLLNKREIEDIGVFCPSFVQANFVLKNGHGMRGGLGEKSQLIKPWVIWTSLQVLVSVLVFLFWSTLAVINHYGDNSLLIYIVEFLGLTIRFYMLMIVSSFYKQLEERNLEERERLRDLVNSEHWYNSA